MVIQVMPQGAPARDETCVWMHAGVLAYRLCNRNFDCEHCPLDAALRGDPRAAIRGDAPTRAIRAAPFPDDRRYSRGHTWLKPLDAQGARLRFGLDAFAACVIGAPRCVAGPTPPHPLDRDDPACCLGLAEGDLPLGAPLPATLGRRNPVLESDPGALVTDPYGDGWIVELTPRSPDDLRRLLRADDARRQALLDLRRFRRRVAFELLSEAPDSGPRRHDGQEATTDLRELIGAECFLDLLRELVH